MWLCQARGESKKVYIVYLIFVAAFLSNIFDIRSSWTFQHFQKLNIGDFCKIASRRKLKYLRAEYICQNGACRFNCPGTEIWQRFEREKLFEMKVDKLCACVLHCIAIWLNDCTMFNHLAKFKVTNTLVAASIVHQFAFHFLLFGATYL